MGVSCRQRTYVCTSSEYVRIICDDAVDIQFLESVGFWLGIDCIGVDVTACVVSLAHEIFVGDCLRGVNRLAAVYCSATNRPRPAESANK